MNDFLTSFSADNRLLWALFILGVVTSSALMLSLVSSVVIRLGSALAARLGRRKTPENGMVDNGDVVP